MPGALTTWLSSGWTQAALLGSWFGIVHAFDADHLATIGGLAVGNGKLTPTGYALRWASGHAASLGAVATVVLGLHVLGIVAWTGYAEYVVGVSLFVIGTNTLRTAWRTRSELSGAVPEAMPHATAAQHSHIHFFAPAHVHPKVRSGRVGVLLGMVHGCAGSAGVLALLPLARLHGAFESAFYLACFSLGVAAGAIGFAKAFALLAKRGADAAEWGSAFQATIGLLAIATGAWLLIETSHGGG
jgi:nickel/cobalt transporter (NicO) family protein